MGVTIHWKGSTKDEDVALKVVNYAYFMAEALKWDVKLYKEQGIVQIDKVFNESRKVEFAFPTFYGNEMIRKMEERGEKVKGVKSYIFGVIINPPPPMNTESIEISFYKYRGRYEMKAFCKTQVFNEKEINNIVVHQVLALMLKTIKSTWIPNLYIDDEGEFYNKWNFEVLTNSHIESAEQIYLIGEELQKAGIKAEIGVKLGSGAIEQGFF